MEFVLSIWVDRPPAQIFAFLRDKDKYVQPPDSPVRLLVQTTPGVAGMGTRYREVVRMIPFVPGGCRREIISEITRFDPYERIEEDFAGAGMAGHLTYRFLPEEGGTRIVQQQTLYMQGWLTLLTPVVARLFRRRLQARLEGIKALMEHG